MSDDGWDWHPGARFTNGFSITIKIRWKFCFTLTPILTQWSLQNFVHGTTAVLSWHVMCKHLLRSDGQQRSYGKAKLPSNLNCRQKNVSETGPWSAHVIDPYGLAADPHGWAMGSQLGGVGIKKKLLCYNDTQWICITLGPEFWEVMLVNKNNLCYNGSHWIRITLGPECGDMMLVDKNNLRNATHWIRITLGPGFWDVMLVVTWNHGFFRKESAILTHCGLVIPYDDRDLGQHWLR